MTTVPPLPTTTTATATATSSPLGMLPDDQRQIILSYLTCSDLLTLTQVSKAVKNIALRSHILISTTTKSRSNDPIISQQQQQQQHNNNNNNNEIENEVLSSTSASAATEFMSTNSLRDSIGHMRIEPLLLQRRWTTIATSHNHNNNDNHNHNNNMESLSSSLSLSNSLVQPEQYLLSNPNNNHNHYYHTNHNLHCWITERNLFQLLQRFTSLRVLKVYNLSSTTSSSISSTSITVPLNSSLDIIHIINTSPCASTLIHIELHSIHLKQYYYNSSSTTTNNKNNIKNNEQNIKAVPLQLPKNQNCNIQQLKLSNGIIFCNYNPIIQSFVTDMMNLHTLHLDGLCCISDDEFYKMNNMLFHPNHNTNNNNNGNEENDQLLQRHHHHHHHRNHHHPKPKQSKSNLLELSIQNASKLIQPTLQSTSLTKLNMSKCALLTNICNIKCPNLLYIDLSHCQRLKDVVGGNNMINQLLYNCPNLETVLLNTCTSIHNVDIRCNNRLKRLEMNLCSGLESVRIDCKELICLEVC